MSSRDKPFALHLLGGCALTGSEGLVGGRVAQRRRLACLAVIAAAGRRGAARDRLVTVLWPDSGDERARRLLSDTLYVLRSAMGEVALVSAGDRIAVNPDVVACDLWVFDEALQRGDPEVAVAAYGGPFLDAFHLPDVPDFAQWADAERDRYDRAYARALEILAGGADERKDAAAAVAWWRRLAAVRPYDAAVAHALVRALETAGDRAGALKHIQIHTTLVREQLEVEPDHALLDLATRLRSAPNAAPSTTPSTPPAVPDRPTVTGAIETPDRSSESETSASTGRARAAAVPLAQPEMFQPQPRGQSASDRSRRSKPLAWLTAALLLSGVTVAGLRSVVADPRPEPRSDLVAVLPFAVRGDSGVQYLGDALVELLATGLDGVGELQTVNPRSVLNVVRGGSRPVEHVDLAMAARTAGRLGASQFILGDVTEAGGGIRIRAELYQRGRDEPVADATVEGTRGEVFALADRLALQLLAGVFDGPQTRLNRSAALSTRSLPALRAYLEGERAFRAVEDITAYERAVVSFRRAVDADSTFALAHYRLSVAGWWAGDRPLSREASVRAFQLRDRLAPRDQQLLTAWRTARGGDAEAAERLYGDLLLRYPNDAEASFQLGDLLRNTAVLRARSRTEALGPLRRALAIDARNGCARCSLLWLELSVGNPASADTLVTGFDPPALLEQRIIATAAIARGVDAAAQEAALRRLAGVDDGELALSTAWAAAGRGDARFLRRAFELLVAPRRSPNVRVLGELSLAQLALMQGQLALADDALRRLELIDPTVGRANRALLAAFPFRDPSRSELAALAAALAADTATRVDPPTGLLPDSALAPWLRGYLRSVVALRSGAPAPPTVPSPVDPEVRAMADLLAADVAARRAVAAGDPEAGLAALEQAGRRVPFQPSDLSPLLAFAQTRFLRAELLVRAGREREALAWYHSIGEVPIWDWAYIAAAELRQGEIHERMGDRTQAEGHYARAVALWRGADPSLQPLVRQARLALDRLRMEAGR